MKTLKILKPLIRQLMQIIREGYDLGKRELPLIAHEILRYSFWAQIMQVVVHILGAAALVSVAILLARKGELYWFGALFVGGFAVAVVGDMLTHIVQLLKIRLAPRVFLLETLKSYLDN